MDMIMQLLSIGKNMKVSFFFSVKVDSSGNSMEVVNTEYKDVYYGNTPPFDIDQYKKVY